jgi:hypothetical protein
MVSEAPFVDWDNILDKLYFYKGTIKVFCKKNNISVHQLYYRRKWAIICFSYVTRGRFVWHVSYTRFAGHKEKYV